MDSGWAVVLGATIALIGSAIVPWIREAVGRKAERDAARRDSIRKLIPEVLGFIMQHHENRQARMWNQGLRAKEVKATAQLSLLLKPDEWKVSAILRIASARAEDGDGAEIVDAATSALSSWFSGAVSLDTAAGAFEYDAEVNLKKP